MLVYPYSRQSPRPRFHLTLFVLTATAPPQTYTLSLHDALPICDRWSLSDAAWGCFPSWRSTLTSCATWFCTGRSEEHTSELQSRGQLVCRLLLEKKKTHQTIRLNTLYQYIKSNTEGHQRPEHKK